MKNIHSKIELDNIQLYLSKGALLHPLLFLEYEKQLKKLSNMGKIEPTDDIRFKWISERYQLNRA